MAGRAIQPREIFPSLDGVLGAPTSSTTAEGHDVSGKQWAGRHVLPGVIAFGMPALAFCTGTGRPREGPRHDGVWQGGDGKAVPKPLSCFRGVVHGNSTEEAGELGVTPEVLVEERDHG